MKNIYNIFTFRAGIWLIILTLLGAIFFYTTCVSDVPWGLRLPKTGQVIDAETGKPISGAYIVARWGGGTIGWFAEGSHGGCIHREIVMTDADGIYQIPSVEKIVPIDWVHVPWFSHKYGWNLTIYAPNYIRDIDELSFVSKKNEEWYSERRKVVGDKLYGDPPDLFWYSHFLSNQKLEPIKLIKNTINTSNKMKYFSSMFRDTKCHWSDPGNNTVLSKPLFDDAYKTICLDGADLTVESAELMHAIWYEVTSPSKEKKIRDDTMRTLLGDDAYHRKDISFNQPSEFCKLLKE